VAVALVASVGPPAAFAASDRATTVLDQVAANAPRFDPARPADLEQFATIPDLHSVYFEYRKARIRPEAASILEHDVEWLKANPFHEVVIAAHADARGSEQYNLGLAQRRAQALRDELVSRGVRGDRIVLASYGEGLPACTESSEECFSQNRRADILVRRAPQMP